MFRFFYLRNAGFGKNHDSELASEKRLFQVFPYFISFILIGCLSFWAYRLWFFLNFVEIGDASRQLEGVLTVFLMGARFDAKVMSIFTLVLSILYLIFLGGRYLISLISKKGNSGHSHQHRHQFHRYQFKVITALSFILLNFASLGQLQFYSFFHTPFSNAIFGLFSDDTRSILSSIWHDYPIVRLVLVLLIASFLQYQLVFSLTSQISRFIVFLKQRKKLSHKIHIAFNGLILVAMLLLARGSFGLFPLNMEDTSLTNNPTLNFAAWNPFSSLEYAWSEYKVINQISLNEESIPDALARFGYTNMQEVADDLGLGHQAVLEDRASIERMLYTEVQKSSNTLKEKEPPNIVLALMESWGGYFREFDNEKNDLYGALRKHMTGAKPTDIVFENFFAAQGFTFPTIEYLLLHSYITPLSENLKYGRQTFPSSALLPFKKAGYKVIFIYSGDLLWHNIGLILKKQYFDEAYGVTDILHRYPEAPMSPSWNATSDEYLMKFAYEKLKEETAKNEKVFILTLSMSNHTPNDIPKGYTPFPLDWESVKSVAHYPKEQTMKILATYQYSSHQVGKLMDAIEADQKLADKTIVVATGDHHLRIAFDYLTPRENRYLAQVMDYFHIPEKYLPMTPFDRSVFAGHQDIFPTLYNLALPAGTRYINLGNNLLSPIDPGRAFSLGLGYFFSKEGAVMPFLQSDNPAIFVPGKQSFFKWQEKSDRPKYLEATDTPSPLLIKQARVQRAQAALRDIYIRQIVSDLEKRSREIQAQAKAAH